jgi:hypothetical protein
LKTFLASTADSPTPWGSRINSPRSFFLDLELMEYPNANRMLETKFFSLGIGQGYQLVGRAL